MLEGMRVGVSAEEANTSIIVLLTQGIIWKAQSPSTTRRLSPIWKGYPKVWTSYVTQVATAFLAVLTLPKDWGAHKSSWRRTAVGLLIIALMALSAYNTYQTGRRNQEQQQQAEARNNKLQASVDTANDAQANNTTQFLKQFAALSDKLAMLQTKAATEELRTQAAALQAELTSRSAAAA